VKEQSSSAKAAAAYTARFVGFGREWEGKADHLNTLGFWIAEDPAGLPESPLDRNRTNAKNIV
jgi:hypothetical protein